MFVRLGVAREYIKPIAQGWRVRTVRNEFAQ